MQKTLSAPRRGFVLGAAALAVGAALGLASAPAAAQQAPAKLIITAIPDDGDADRMRENFGALARHLGKAVGIPVEYMHVENYAASVTALATGRAHIAWLGAVTTAQARMQMGDGLTILGCRDIDKGFVSYFIANPATGLGTVADLGELAKTAQGKGWTFTFGSKSSTSGHMMPRKYFMDQSGTTPERVFRTVAYSGSHDVVMQMVADGTYNVGALNYASWDKAADDLKARAPIIYKTPPYTNYAVTARADLGPELLGKLRAALLAVDGSTPEGAAVLKYLKAGKFIEADISEWQGYVDLLESGIDIGG
ncbi:phosphate/phosphite/phosphonate ABC transporter substrate-binding protein [Pseudothauera nasutitermitis]|uniref:Phosphate/phosphite/phosphonate ABC transporter substrate-binding protein n=1 Tax=Pseudothauera nasutitermitis TaxID=2565930 RepID=A0A4S4AWX0_9RHOO|nr:phosphate/phosphite/phosphonate ABC transporter substrate-binding protein [Pseudothauera nasutitermitis]THF64555.1 phosphate/phosphite/phosphonate ABC transporter substrate-binding protein [Pseudothauera nasutitermitis]